ncbi:MAG: CCA tRNA nucleotidyltransferase, partial [Carnobacterium sp.]|nr:CCA tRNA nucleotidyltransferase [Carnobacterium sp.]
IQVEFMKLLLGEGRQKGLNLFVESALYSYCPGLAEYQKELLYFASLKNDQNYNLRSPVAAWTLLLFTLEKQEEDVDSFLRAWKCSKKMIQQVKVALKALNFRVKQPLDPLLLYQSGYAIILEVEELLLFLDKPADLTRLEELMDSLPMKDKKEMAVSGFDLLIYFNKSPGKWLGEALDKIEVAIILGDIANEKKAILNWLSETNEIKKEQV